MRRIAQTAAAVTVERALAALDLPINALLFFIVLQWGVVEGFIVGLVVEVVIVLAVLELHIQTSRRGFDVTGASMIVEFIMSPDKPATWRTVRAFKWLLRKTLNSYWLMIIVGSVLYIEPDYVTILLKRKDESRLSVFLRVTLPASVWSIAVWIAIFWASIEGYQWAASIV